MNFPPFAPHSIYSVLSIPQKKEKVQTKKKHLFCTISIILLICSGICFLQNNTAYGILIGNFKNRGDTMNRTKEAIVNAFWELLDEKPYNKITVKDIVDRCQINRNTFYYHFHDIPELLESIIKKDADSVVQNYASFHSLPECLSTIIEHSLKRKKAVLHIYRSVQREVFLDQLERMATYVVTEYIHTLTKEIQVPEDDLRLLIRLYKCILVGIILDWLDHGMDYNLEKDFTRLSELFQDAGKQIFLKAANLLPENSGEDQ